jgi:uncharacterized protein (TIGR01244 family)
MTQYQQIDSNIFIGGQPTRQDLEEARRRGVRTVIDFRLPTETANSNADLARQAGIGYVNIPVNRAALSSAQVGEFEAAMEQHPGPYLLHCATGARAALMLVLARARAGGWPAQHTFDEAEALGFNFRTLPEFSDIIERSTGA